MTEVTDVTGSVPEHSPKKKRSGKKKAAQRVDAKAEFDRTYALRNIFCVLDPIESWINYRRNFFPTPMPGEPGYSRVEHVEAIKSAIDDERERLFERAAEHQGRHSQAAHEAECEKRFAAAIELIAHRNPFIAEAWRYDAALNRQSSRSPKPDARHGLRLAWSSND